MGCKLAYKLFLLLSAKEYQQVGMLLSSKMASMEQEFQKWRKKRRVWQLKVKTWTVLSFLKATTGVEAVELFHWRPALKLRSCSRSIVLFVVQHSFSRFLVVGFFVSEVEMQSMHVRLLFHSRHGCSSILCLLEQPVH
mmetsp:Transcript_17567/g.30254  ORF Transcript_17567/g.30254 Transcript_17567/m.30254 type:complete len:138 (+) Transcript_17567:320-733(+)